MKKERATILFTVEEAAEQLRVHPHTIRKFARSGKLPSVQISTRGLRIPSAALQALAKTERVVE